jgi:tight adherence protein B
LVGIVCYVLAIAIIPKRLLTDASRTRSQLDKLERESLGQYMPSDDSVSVLRNTMEQSNPVTRAFLSLPGAQLLWPRLMKAGLSKSLDTYFLALLAILVGLIFLFRHMAIPGVLLAIGLTCLAGWMYINRRIDKRNQAFLEQFPEALDMIVRSVKSGYPLGASIRIVADNMSAPLSSEFRIVADETSYGSSLVEALQRLSQRIDEPDIRFFVVVLAVQQEVGGNLAEVLTNLSGIIRKRKHLRLKIRALTSEGRATAWVLGLLPVFEFAAIYYIAPKHLEPLFYTTQGNIILASAVAIVLLGAFIVRQMINMEI